MAERGTVRGADAAGLRLAFDPVSAQDGYMRVLILGGTEFVGKAFVNDALARGWHVTTLNRQTHPAQQ